MVITLCRVLEFIEAFEAFVCFIQCLNTLYDTTHDTTMLLHCEHISKADSYFHNNNCGYTSGAEMSQTNKRQPFRQALFYHSPAKH